MVHQAIQVISFKNEEFARLIRNHILGSDEAGEPDRGEAEPLGKRLLIMREGGTDSTLEAGSREGVRENRVTHGRGFLGYAFSEILV